MSAIALALRDGKSVVRCECKLVQFSRNDKTCPRCKEPYEAKAIEPITPVLREESKEPRTRPEDWLRRTMPLVLRYFRERRGLSQGQLASRMKVQRTYISKCEMGKTLPNPKSLRRFVTATGFSLTKILFMCEEMAKA